MTVARLRVRSVKLKSGGSFRVLRNERGYEVARTFASHCDEIRHQRADDMAGFAVVAWGYDGAVSHTLVIGDSRHVPRQLAPEYVKMCLTEHVCDGRNDEPPKPGGAA